MTGYDNSALAKIAALFPHCIRESRDAHGKPASVVDFDLLRQELAGALAEGPQERYRLDWPGKRAAILAANTPPAHRLRPCPAESVDFERTHNLFIEGDNLEALKLLQADYAGKVKMIYIDPPYNTGNDFIYKDKFAESHHVYRRRARQQTSETGDEAGSEHEEDGRLHANWLSMMYSRLKMARPLLTDDGVIFISISEKELANLKIIADEIFGAANFIELFSWQKTTTPANLSRKTKKTCEYILAYQKKEDVPLWGTVKAAKSSNGLMNQSNAVGRLVFPAYLTRTKLADGVYPAGMYGTKAYDIELEQATAVKGGVFTRPVHLRGKFKWTQPYLEQQLRTGVQVFIQSRAFSPSYEKAAYAAEKSWNLLNQDCGVGTNENASSELDKLFSPNFSDKLYPKPLSLLRYLINTNVGKDGLILDFFAGSATTAHAVMQINAADGGSRRFIMVQLAERTPRHSAAGQAGYLTIADIGKERLRRAAAAIRQTAAADGQPLPANWDGGFRVLKIGDDGEA